jgi:ABC-2 type transport system ATP-binding protein
MQSVIELENVSKKFSIKGKDFWALKGVSFSVKEGEIFGLLGPNGAGKTTILNIILGLLVQDFGTVRIFGKDLLKNKDLMSRINNASGNTRFHWALRSKDILRFYAMIYNIPKEKREAKIEKLVKFFGLEGLGNSKFYLLSTGERMRLTLAKALINEPQLLLLDEPTLGLDPDISLKVREEIERINRKFKTTMILTTHYMQEAEQLASRIGFINRGQIVDMGNTEKVKLSQFSHYEIFLRLRHMKDRVFLKARGFRIRGNTISKSIGIDENISEVIGMLVAKRYEIVDIETKKPTLEDYFVKILAKEEGGKQ